jgi:hypothetical protein
VEQHLGTFNNVTGKVLRDLGELADQFSVHGRSLAEAVELLDKSNRRTEESVANRRANIETLVTTLDARTDDFGQRLQRFSGLLDESLDAATTRARRSPASSPRPATKACNDRAAVRARAHDLGGRAQAHQRDAQRGLRRGLHAGAHHVQQSAERFTEIMQGMKQMAAEMQQELETTRAELRRGIFELPQETAESAAQMRRVIVDQIEALAELNRIVARHGRSLDTAEPVRREPEPVRSMPELVRRPEPRREPRAHASCAAEHHARRHHAAPPTVRGDITGAPPRRPEQPGPAERRQRPQRRLAQRSVDARIARGQSADCAARTARARARREAPGSATTSSRSNRSRSTSRA